MKKNLNEEVSRIKNMMKQINENDFGSLFNKPAVGESQWERFKERHSGTLHNLYILLHKITPEVYDNLPDEKREELGSTMQNYDENVEQSIEHWIFSPNDFHINDIVTLAIENSDRYGTEPQMVLYAIEDYLRVFGLRIEDEDDEEDYDDDNSHLDSERKTFNSMMGGTD